MPVRVLILGDRASEPLFCWSTQVASSPEWERCALELLSSRQVGAARAEVYLCLSEDLRHHLDHQVLDAHVRHAMGGTWDAHVYLVLNSRQAMAYDPLTQADALAAWFQTALRCGIKDLLEVWCDGLDQIDTTLLRAARDRAAVREAVSRGLDPATSWRVIVQKPGNQLGSFLEPFVHWQTGGTAEHRLILVLDRPGAARQHSRVTQELGRFGASIEVVATLGVPATQRLIDLCEERRLTLLRFLGPYELRYFLQRLNAPPGMPPLPPISVHETGERREVGSAAPHRADLRELYQPGITLMMLSIREQRPQYLRALTLEQRLADNLVRAADGDTEALRAERTEVVRGLNELSLEVLGTSFNDLARMASADDGPRAVGDGAARAQAAGLAGVIRAILVTLALDPGNDREGCLLAARLVGLIRDSKAPGVEMQLHWSAMSGSSGDMLLEMPAPKIWIYLGQAGPGGLREAVSGRIVATAGWLAGLPQASRQLSLALLFAKRSLDSAREMAAGGVACAIGYNGQAPLPELEPGIRALVQLILTEGAARRSVEKALLAAQRALRAKGLEDPGLEAFFSEAP